MLLLALIDCCRLGACINDLPPVYSKDSTQCITALVLKMLI
jgi:hypothetical protein